MVLWGDNCPTHCISTVLTTTDQRAIVTGCNDGQLAIWDVAENWEVNIIMMLEIKTGHHSPISTKMNIKSKVHSTIGTTKLPPVAIVTSF
jgi:hypothetical protein